MTLKEIWHSFCREFRTDPKPVIEFAAGVIITALVLCVLIALGASLAHVALWLMGGNFWHAGLAVALGLIMLHIWREVE